MIKAAILSTGFALWLTGCYFTGKNVGETTADFYMDMSRACAAMEGHLEQVDEERWLCVPSEEGVNEDSLSGKTIRV